MAAVVLPSEEELYLWAILTDPSGLDLAEFSWHDPESETGCYRAWDFQWKFYRDASPFQVEQGGRSVGKTVGITMRACSMPFIAPGQSMLITAPELNHLRPLTDAIEGRLLGARLLREMLPATKSNGMARQPHWQTKFKNGTRLVSRLPQRDGKGLKGQHVLKIEMDECFPAGTLVTTRRGQVPIEAVEKGDQVLTHRNRWRPVIDTMTRERMTVKVRGQGHPGLVCSTNHKFWASRSEERYVPIGDRVQRMRTFSEAGPVSAIELEGAYWCSPTTFPKVKGGSIPSLRGPGPKPAGYAPVVDVASSDTYWVVGLYLAEGCISGKSRSRPSLSFSIHQDEVAEVAARMTKIGLTPRGPYAIRTGLGVNFVFYSGVDEWRDWLERHFGTGSYDMQIAPWALGLPRACREELLAGLIYGDGFEDPDERYASGRMKLTTVSRSLAVTARLLGLSLGYSVSMYWNDLAERVTTIRGREIRGEGFYQVVFNAEGQGFEFENRRYTAVREVTELGGTETLYDLTVDEDHTFIAEGFVVFNSQDFPAPGWTEIVETLNRGLPGASWKCHGVPRGVRDRFWEITEGAKSDEDISWKVHRPIGPMRPTWSPEERAEKVRQYGGSRQHIDFKRNIYGLHGDAAATAFVLAKIMACTDTEDTSKYNSEVYACCRIISEQLSRDESRRQGELVNLLQLPESHRNGWSQTRERKEVGAPSGYESFWAGMDVGVTSDPSEILIAGQKRNSDQLHLLTRIHLQRINIDDQMFVVQQIFEYYGSSLRALGVDSTGVGFPVADQLSRHPDFGSRVHGFNFSEKIPVGFEDRELVGSEKKKDLVIMRNMIEASTDWLRNDYIHAGNIKLPFDKELLLELQGQTYVQASSGGGPYGNRKVYGGGSFHTLDSLKCMMAAKFVPPIRAMMDDHPDTPPVLDLFGM